MLNFKTNLAYGQAPNLSGSNVSSQQILSGLRLVPAGTAFVTGTNGRDYAFIFPSLFFSDPQLPAIEYIRGDDGAFRFSRIIENLSMGSARDYSIISSAKTGQAQFVVADHGSEYSNQAWPFGHVWVATDNGSGFEFKQISQVAAFNHAVATGDINADGLIDIVVSNMGVKAGGVNLNLHAYINQSNSNFKQQAEFARSTSQTWGSGAVAIADVNQDLKPEVIEVNYFPESQDWGAIRIFSRNGTGNYEPESVLPRDGLFSRMGATRVIPFDYDNDTDLDLCISFEGQYPNLPGKYSGNGIEIYCNEGSKGFRRATPELLSKNEWPFSELQFREFQIVDFDGDGYLDIFLNGWWGNAIQVGADWDLSSQMLRNMGGKQFLQLNSKNSAGLNFSSLGKTTQYVRVVNSFDGAVTPELLAIQSDGSLVSARLEPTYRNVDEELVVFGTNRIVLGYGGNDVFIMKGSKLFIHGGDGIDTAVYRGLVNNYQVRAANEVTIKDKRQDQESLDTLVNVERINFSDGHVALDILGNAGKAYRVYKAAFARDPMEGDKAGLGFWINSIDNGMDMVEIAARFIDSPEFRGLYGQNPSNADFLTKVYTNVLGRTPDQGGYSWWLNELNTNPSKTKAKVLADFSESGENQTGVAALIGNGITYEPWVG